ncbi:MAG: hypothetical protein HOD63_16570 [Bacteroidetes bacterium]|nr:hypothetical protein [Bacteroidota bacterium]MBT5528889.1 hypothetical protein [Cytophagia bacterium]MBT3421975.1 hypothetical protein [Bacteroidota bacterium]MBT3800434.1 hypothetical protein [Bacteroidota bacterium]MBT3934322.1 hypothetical protein [Bacteroidota bacterium]
MHSSKHINKIKPPSKSKGVITDLVYFLLRKPKQATQIKFDTDEERDDYNHRVMQRLGIDPNRYSVLNIHKIGVDAPVSHVFNELLRWNGDSSCWPNHIAKVDFMGDDLDRLQILPFGFKKYPFRFMKSFFGLQIIPLFLLHIIRIKRIPDDFDFDNARYILYECSGGYPIGIFVLYVHSSIPSIGELAKTQLNIIVGFDFYGKEKWKSQYKGMNKIWEYIHNRVTANVLNRMKQLVEWRSDTIQKNE